MSVGGLAAAGDVAQIAVMFVLPSPLLVSCGMMAAGGHWRCTGAVVAEKERGGGGSIVSGVGTSAQCNVGGGIRRRRPLGMHGPGSRLARGAPPHARLVPFWWHLLFAFMMMRDTPCNPACRCRSKKNKNDYPMTAGNEKAEQELTVEGAPFSSTCWFENNRLW